MAGLIIGEERDRGSGLECGHRGVELLLGCPWAVRQCLFGRRIEDCHGLDAQLSVDQSRSGLAIFRDTSRIDGPGQSRRRTRWFRKSGWTSLGCTIYPDGYNEDGPRSAIFPAGASASSSLQSREANHE